MMDLKSKIRSIPDFPKKGILFRDITTLLQDGAAFREAIDSLADFCKDKQIDIVAGPEARGFLIGAPLAYRLGAGFVPVRKKGKLPGATLQAEYKLEYGEDALEIHADAIKPGQKVLVVDDLLATGGTIFSTIDLVKKCGGEIVGVAFLIELVDLHGRKNLKDYDVISLIEFEGE